MQAANRQVCEEGCVVGDVIPMARLRWSLGGQDISLYHYTTKFNDGKILCVVFNNSAKSLIHCWVWGIWCCLTLNTKKWWQLKSAKSSNNDILTEPNITFKDLEKSLNTFYCKTIWLKEAAIPFHDLFLSKEMIVSLSSQGMLNIWRRTVYNSVLYSALSLPEHT